MSSSRFRISIRLQALEHRRYLTTFSITDYGATGNGVSDDRPAIQAALNAAQNGDTLLIPNGTFLVGGQLILSKSIKLLGAGRDSRLRASLPSFNLVYLTADNVTFQQIAFEGAANSDATGQFGIFTDAGSTASGGKIDRCYFTSPAPSNGLNNGVKLETGSNGWNILDTTFEHLIGTISGTGYGVLVGASSDHTIARNQFQGATGEGRHAIYLAGGTTGTLVEANSIDHFNSSSISMYSKTHQATVMNNTIRGNFITDEGLSDNGTAAIELAGKVVSNVIDSNIITRPGRHGIILGDAAQGGFATDNIITGNQISYAGQFGIIVEGAANTTVSNNIINDASLTDPGGYSAIHVQSFYTSDPPILATGTVISNNQMRGIGNAPARFRYGIWLNPSTPSPVNSNLLNNKISPGIFGVIEIAPDSQPTTTTTGNTTINGVLQADANSDGRVNSLDFNLLAANFGRQGVFCFNGDFNYDGVVDALDFNLLLSTYALKQS